jgi:hypothetical protein
MVEILSGTGGTEVELKEKFHFGKGLTVELSFGTLASRRVPIVPPGMRRRFLGFYDNNKKNHSSGRSSSKKPAVAGCINRTGWFALLVLCDLFKRGQRCLKAVDGILKGR